MNHVRVSVERSEKGLLYAFVFFLKKIENFLLKKTPGHAGGSIFFSKKLTIFSSKRSFEFALLSSNARNSKKITFFLELWDFFSGKSPTIPNKKYYLFEFNFCDVLCYLFNIKSSQKWRAAASLEKKKCLKNFFRKKKFYFPD